MTPERNQNIPETDLINGCMEGNRRMQEELYRRFSPRMYAVCLRYAGNAEEAEDILQECGTMNVFFIIGNTAVTPDLEHGTILDGVTRQSAITLLKEMGFSIEERPLSIDNIIEAYKAGLLYEVFGTGTAATISLIKELRYKDFVMHFDVDKWKTAPTVKKWLTDIREGRREDKYNWMWKI